jgi:NADP-dependent 3-hydroxy acid dehydrogenase YdfG
VGEARAERERAVSDLSGKRALVTGAGMGIGQGIAVELARRGAFLGERDRLYDLQLHGFVG